MIRIPTNRVTYSSVPILLSEPLKAASTTTSMASEAKVSALMVLFQLVGERGLRKAADVGCVSRIVL